MGTFQNIDAILQQALSEIEQAEDSSALENARVAVLGKNGSFTQLGKTLSALPPEQKKSFGCELNTAKKQIEDNKMVVLIDEEKIEKMAEDENFRKQYEGIIANAASGMAQLGSSLNSTGATVKGFGMQVNDNGTASYFAVLEKSSAAQRERIEKKAEEKKEAKKAARKKAEKEEREERLKKSVDDETVTIQANSIEELLQKIQDYSYSNLSDSLQTAGEKQVGQKIDFSV